MKTFIKTVCFVFLSLLLVWGFFIYFNFPKYPTQPADYDQTGRVPTLNKMGWMHPIIDSYTKQFLEQAKIEKHPLLEVGAAFGYASLAALKAGATVWTNDLDERHLKTFEKNVPHKLKRNLKLIPGDFPDGVKLPNNFFGAILAVRVLHFFDPKKLDRAVAAMFKALVPGGKAYIVAETPYLKNWQKFIPVYEERRKKGALYPGLIEDVSQYNSVNSPFIPKLLHFLDPDVLKKVFEKGGFIVQKVGFINRTDYPPSMRLDGRESVGIIAIKPKN